MTMAVRQFTINQTPHEFQVGDVSLFLEPEVEGAVFAEAYAQLREVQADAKRVQKSAKASSTKHKAADADADGMDPQTLVKLNKAMRDFLRGFMLPDSAAVFDGMRLPDRVLVQMMEAVAELYGSGSKDGQGKDQAEQAPESSADDDGGPSSAS